MNTSKSSKLTKRQQAVLSSRYNQTETARKSLYRPGLWATAAGYTSAALLYRLADSGLIGFGVEGGGSVDCHYAAPTAEGERIRELTQGVPLSRRQQELLLAMLSGPLVKVAKPSSSERSKGLDEGWPWWHDGSTNEYAATSLYALTNLGLAAIYIAPDSWVEAALTPDGEELAALLSQVR